MLDSRNKFTPHKGIKNTTWVTKKKWLNVLETVKQQKVDMKKVFNTQFRRTGLV